MGTPVHELAAQAPNVTVPDDFDLGDEDEKLDDCSAKPFLFVLYVQITSQRKEISLFEFENRRAASV
jgi:hypothetical protein